MAQGRAPLRLFFIGPPPARCRGAACRSRHNAADPYRPSLKWYALPNCHCEERSDVAISGRHLQSVQAIAKMVCTPELSLRGRFAPVAISRTNFRIRRSCPVIHPGPARLPRRFAPRNDTSGWRAVHQCPCAVEYPCTRRSVSAATDAIGLYVFTAACTICECLPEIATSLRSSQ